MEKNYQELLVICRRLLAKEKSHNVVVPKVLERDFSKLEEVVAKIVSSEESTVVGDTISVGKEVGDLA